MSKIIDIKTTPIHFYNENWVNYFSVLNEDLKEDQICNFTHTNIKVRKNDKDLVFVFDNELQQLNQIIEDKIQNISIEDNLTEICNEVYFTSKIEGCKTTIARTIAIHNGEKLKQDNYISEKMIKNCFDATKYLNLVQKMNKDILLKTWNILINEVCENKNIQGPSYRIGAVSVGTHNGLDYRLVPEYMDKWLEFYNSNSFNNYPFIKAALLHLSFEMIHPFPDGNGRLGRLLMNNYLITRGFEQIKGISFTKTIETNLQGYINAFVDSESNDYNDCTPFLKYMMNVYANTIIALEKEQKRENVNLE